MDQVSGVTSISRSFFFVALVFLAAAVVEKGLNVFGGTIPLIYVLPREFLYWTVPPLLFVIAILLRQIREESKRS